VFQESMLKLDWLKDSFSLETQELNLEHLFSGVVLELVIKEI